MFRADLLHQTQVAAIRVFNDKNVHEKHCRGRQFGSVVRCERRTQHSGWSAPVKFEPTECFDKPAHFACPSFCMVGVDARPVVVLWPFHRPDDHRQIRW